MNKFEVRVSRKTVLGLIKDKLTLIEKEFPVVLTKTVSELEQDILDDELYLRVMGVIGVQHLSEDEIKESGFRNSKISADITENKSLLKVLKHYNQLLNFCRMVEICQDEVFTLSEYLSSIIHKEIKEL